MTFFCMPLGLAPGAAGIVLGILGQRAAARGFGGNRGMAFAYVLELPQKMSYDADEYARVQHNLYAYFACVGGPLKILSIVLAAVLAVMLRHDHAAFGWTPTGCGPARGGTRLA